MKHTRTLLTGTAVALALTGTALAQDATIYYSTPTIQSGQPVVNPTPVIQPVPVYNPVPVQVVPVQDADGTTYPAVPATPPSEDDASYLGIPQPQTSQHDSSVSFVSGGIGAFEKNWFDSHSSEYKLKVTYSDVTGHHLAGVNVTLNDASGATVMSAVTEGPYLLVNAKPGTYSLNSSYQGETQTKKITLGKGTARTSVTFKDPEGL